MRSQGLADSFDFSPSELDVRLVPGIETYRRAVPSWSCMNGDESRCQRRDLNVVGGLRSDRGFKAKGSAFTQQYSGWNPTSDSEAGEMHVRRRGHYHIFTLFSAKGVIASALIWAVHTALLRLSPLHSPHSKIQSTPSGRFKRTRGGKLSPVSPERNSGCGTRGLDLADSCAVRTGL